MEENVEGKQGKGEKWRRKRGKGEEGRWGSMAVVPGAQWSSLGTTTFSLIHWPSS